MDEPRAKFPSVRWVAQTFVIRAKTTQAVCGLLLLVVLGLVGALDLMAQTPQNDGDYFIRDARTVQEWDAVDLARAYIVENGLSANPDDEDNDEATQPQTIDNREFTVFLMYRARDGGTVMRPEILAEIEQVESRFLTDPEYPNVCLKATDPDATTAEELAARPCLPRLSFVETPDDVASVAYPRFTSAMDADTVESTLALYASAPQLESLRDIFFDSEFSAEDLTSTYARSMFPMGLPLPDDGTGKAYKGEDDRFQEQRNEFDRRIEAFRSYVAFEYDPDGEKPVEILISGFRVLQYFFQATANDDLVWATGSVMVVWLYVSFHMQSLFVGSFVMMIVLLTIPMALFVYKVILGIGFYQALTQLSIYIILALGADSAFVYVDAWNQAPSRPGFTMVDRVEYTLRRASKAILVPSLTTMVAFLATSVSDIMPIATFGIFSACLVVVNYILDMALLPAIVVVWERSVRDRERSCLRLKKRAQRHDVVHYRSTRNLKVDVDGLAEAEADGDVENGAAAEGNGHAANGNATNGATSNGGSDAAAASKPTATAAKKKSLDTAGAASFRGAGDMPHPRLVERFFQEKWVGWINEMTPVTIGAFFSLLAVMIWATMQLTPLTETEQWFEDDHPMRLAQTWPLEHFGATDRDKTVEVDVVWGVLGVNREGADPYDTLQRGEPVWDAAFDLSPPAAQQWVLDTCLDESAPGTVDSCFIQDYAAYLGEGAFPFVAGEGENQKEAFLASLRTWATTTDVGREYLASGAVGFGSDGDLAMCEIRFITDLLLFRPYDITVPVYEEWQSWLDERNAAAPASVANALQVAGVSWTWVFSERAMVTNAVQGVIVALVAAWIVLVLSTRNFVMGTLASSCIVGIVGCVLGLMGLLGWEMGTTESISCVLVVGMSVDYVTHIASSYVESEAETRRGRVTRALTEMGISVLAGAGTTLGAGLFLSPATLIFFKKFAVLIASTILFSLAWSLVMFPSLLLVVGPVGDYGSFASVQRWFKAKSSKTKAVPPTSGTAGVTAGE